MPEAGLPVRLTLPLSPLRLGGRTGFDRWRFRCGLAHDSSRDTGELAAVPIEHLHQRLRAVAEQMPSIRDLDRPGGAATHTIGIGTGAVTSHDLDAGMPLQPVGHGGGLAVGQQVDDLASFQIAQDRAVALTAPPGPIIDAEHSRCALCLRGSATSHEAQQRVGADRQAEAPRQACAGFTAERETEVVLEVAEAVSAACAGLGNAGEALGEDTARAMWLRATPSPGLDRDDDAPALPGKVGQGAGVA